MPNQTQIVKKNNWGQSNINKWGQININFQSKGIKVKGG
jgi:hypothetical protein